MTDNQFLTISQINEQQALPNYIQGELGNIEYDFIEPKTQSEVKLLALVCHPHPVHGGTKDNKVVHTLCRAWRDIGIACLRFNFRGVGASEGEFDHGVGEYNDLCSVIDFLKDRYGPNIKIILAGFSFGAFIAAKYASQSDHNAISVNALVLIAPPVQYAEFPTSNTIQVPTLIVQGSADEVVDVASVESWAEVNQNAHLTYNNIVEASHFFHGRLGELKDRAQYFVQNLLN